MSTLLCSLIDEALVLLSIVIFWCTFAIADTADRLQTHKDAFVLVVLCLFVFVVAGWLFVCGSTIF